MYVKGYITWNDINVASYKKALILNHNLHRYNPRLLLIMCGIIVPQLDEYVFNSMYPNV